MKKPIVSIGLALSLVGASALRVHADDKKTLIDKVIPSDIKGILSNVSSVIGIFTGVSGDIKLLEGIAQALGLLQPANGPDIQQLFAQLNSHLDQIAGTLDWKISAEARDNRYGRAMSAFFGLMQAAQSGNTSSEMLADADSLSKQVLFEVEGPDQSAFLRAYSDAVTSGDTGRGDWSAYVGKPEITNGQVYDWRLGIPELLQYIAIRTQVIAVLDPSFKTDGNYRAELLGHRDFLVQQLQKIVDGVKCVSAEHSVPPENGCTFGGCVQGGIPAATIAEEAASIAGSGLNPSIAVCANVYTGSYRAQFATQLTPPDQIVDVNTYRQELIDELPIAELNQAIDSLADLAGGA